MTEPAALTETHTAVIVFFGDRAYKVKKPVDLGFLDFSTVASRREAAHREVELNRRLAPDVYLGVADVIGPDGDPCDHVVVMRRMPEDRRLSLCVTRGDDVDDDVRQVARDLARLHNANPTEPAWTHVGSTDYIAELWRQCFAQLERGRDSLFRSELLDRAEELVRRYLDGRHDLFDQRVAADRIRDGHGDLQADDIYVLPDGPRILDCIEFSDELRWGDVLNDVAFLAMDLERLGAPALADLLLAWHREFSADTWPESLAHHFVAYRAAVRAKVTSIRHEQGESHAADLVRSLLGLAVDHLERGRVRLVLIGGLPGTGKSTLCAALADRLRVVVLRTDELRAGHAEDGGAYGQGRYAPTAVGENYRVLLDQAAPLLRSGESVVLDGSWSRNDLRSLAAELARDTLSDLVELHCVAPSSITNARIAERTRRGDDPSEATQMVAEAMAASFDEWPAASIVDTNRSVDEAVAEALRALGATAPPRSGTASASGSDG
jgi:aminoglycoside phosphotransferase family enzyme/predicted kinase